jgi:LysR family glycine cleavage system transcriptional activator
MTKVPYLRALQAFDVAAAELNLSRAAENLGVTHGAVSRQIKQLEDYLGVALFVRRPDGVEKTEAGEQLHLATRQGFLALDIGMRNVRQSRDRRSITISLSASLAVKWLVPRLADFRRQHSDIALLLDTNDEVIDFSDSNVDVALRYGRPNWGNLHAERLVDEKLIVVASPSLVQGKDLPMSPFQITALPLLQDHFDPSWEKWADTVGLDHAGLSAPHLAFGDTAVMIAAAADGQGVALVRRLLAEDDLTAGRIVQLDNAEISLERGLYFVCRSGDENREVIRLLRNWLFSVI